MHVAPASSHRRTVISGLAAAAMISLSIACGGSDSTSPYVAPPPPVTPPAAGGPVATTSVNMKGSAFSPSAISVSPGANVTFTNSDGINHNVTFDNAAAAASGNFSTGSVILTMPTTPGTYPYQCTIHSGMTGSVQVK